MSVSVDSIFAVPSEIPDQATTASILVKRSEDRSARNSGAHESVARVLLGRAQGRFRNQRARAAICSLRGIYFQKEPKRFYPKRELAAQVLGYVGMDDNGLGGIEREYDERLRGNPGKMLISMDAKRRWFGRVERQPDPGQNVVLTIDREHSVHRRARTRNGDEADQARWRQRSSCRIRTPERCWPWPTVRRSIPIYSTKLRPRRSEEPRRKRRLRARLDVQDGHRRRRSGREADPAGRNDRLPDGRHRGRGACASAITRNSALSR